MRRKKHWLLSMQLKLHLEEFMQIKRTMILFLLNPSLLLLKPKLRCTKMRYKVVSYFQNNIVNNVLHVLPIRNSILFLSPFHLWHWRFYVLLKMSKCSWVWSVVAETSALYVIIFDTIYLIQPYFDIFSYTSKPEWLQKQKGV